jgi:hypothetical protein
MTTGQPVFADEDDYRTFLAALVQTPQRLIYDTGNGMTIDPGGID